ncbi:MAG TPA: FecR domain-containing protein [Polyangiaceae bacterium]
MKNDDREAVALLRQMGRVVVPLLAPEAEARRHRRMSLSVNRLVQGLHTLPPARRRPVLAFTALGAAAATIALFFGAQHLTHPPQAAMPNAVARVVSVSGVSSLWRAGSAPCALVAEQRVDASDELRSSEGSRAELALTGAGKAKVVIAEDTRVRLEQRVGSSKAANEDWLDLEQGLVTLQVEKLPPGLGLSVQTPDARVTVHGTRFSVRVTPRTAAGTVTVVDVSEGRVEVYNRGQAVFLGAGEHWSSERTAPEQPIASGPASSLVGHAASSSASASPSGAATLARQRAARTLESTLAEENRLYTQALAHAGAGEVSPALAALASLIQRYPRSPLAQNARVDRFRLLQQSGSRSAAAQEARRYLSEYPNGFARGEARSLALLGLEAPE